MEPPAAAVLINALLLLTAVSSIAVDPVFNDDVLGLIVFKSGLQDPKSKLSSWNEDDATPCDWDGVFCDRRTNRVAELRLDGFSLSGHIGRGVLRLQFLKVLSLSNNNFNGTIIADVTRIGSLQSIDLSHNNLTGTVPGEIFQQCGSLRSVSFAGNRLAGEIPDSLSSCASLLAVNFSSNQLSGRLPLGFWFSRAIQSIDLSGNLLEGVIEDGIQSLYDLRILNLGRNRFVGRIPAGIGGCFKLRMLDLSRNFLSGGLPESMKQLSLLSSLSVSGNSFTGKIPDWIGDLQNLEKLDLSANSFLGRIPRSIGNIHSMKELNLSQNHFTGILPSSISNFADIVVLDVSQNLLMGSFRLRSTTPMSDYTMIRDDYRNLQVLDLSSNAFSGQVPDNIGALTSLRLLNMSRNHLFGSIPVSIGRLNATEVLDLSSNMLNGTIPPEIGGAASIVELKLQKNFLTGNIPTEIENCTSLTSLILSDNKLTGPVPSSIAKLANLEYVDLSSNSLSGSLPKELADLSHLQNFNVSYNNLEGELPGGGYFNTIPLSSVYGNPSLCGSVVKDSCPSVHPKPIVLNPNSSTPAGASSSPYSPHKRIILSISALIAIGAAAFIAIGVVAVSLLNIHARSASRLSGPGPIFSGEDEFSCSPSTDPNYGKLVIFSGEANFVTGANGLLNKESELGRGGFGVVYKTVLKDGRSFAIKKLTCSGLIKSQEEFETEVKSLGKIRHQNLVALEGYYWTPSLQLLIYEYVPNGSLYKQIHDSENCLSWRQRFDIVLGMARGLAHLHRMNVIHYNLKSTNIIIDGNLQPKVGDFGLARLLPGLDRCILSSKIQSALGYMAPEFACRTVKITEKCDVYGFGVLVLEVVTGRRPVEYMEDDVAVLCDMVRSALEEGEVEKCVDRRLGSFPTEEAVPVMKLGLICASQVPSNRPNMSEVINILELIQCPSEGQEEAV